MNELRPRGGWKLSHPCLYRLMPNVLSPATFVQIRQGHSAPNAMYACHGKRPIQVCGISKAVGTAPVEEGGPGSASTGRNAAARRGGPALHGLIGNNQDDLCARSARAADIQRAA